MLDASSVDYRVVLDEGSLDWRELDSVSLLATAESLADVLTAVISDAAFVDAAYDVRCWGDAAFIDFLYSPGGPLPRDTKVRLQTLVAKCRRVVVDGVDLPDVIQVADAVWDRPSMGLLHALDLAAKGRAMACLRAVMGPAPVGPVRVGHGQERTDLHFISNIDHVPAFWRHVIIREAWPTTELLSRTSAAFPELLFAPTLDLRRFAGGYEQVAPWLIGLLGAINDHFARTIEECRGDSNRVIGRFGALGFEISYESPNTRRNRKAWAQRLVPFEGTEHRCDWHGKRVWNTDRVHFSRPIAERGNRVLIGIFTEHLDT